MRAAIARRRFGTAELLLLAECFAPRSVASVGSQTFATLNTHAKQMNVTVPRDLTHALIFFTGEAVRRIAPTYVPTADRLGIWDKNLSGAAVPARA
jgi:hypothetical protein